MGTRSSLDQSCSQHLGAWANHRRQNSRVSRVDSQAGDVSDQTPLWCESPLHVRFRVWRYRLWLELQVQPLRNHESIIKEAGVEHLQDGE